MRQNFFTTPEAMPFFEKFPCGLIILSGYKIAKINAAALKITGLEKDEVIGRDVSKWIGEEEKKIIEELVEGKRKNAIISFKIKDRAFFAKCFSEGKNILLMLDEMKELEKERKKSQEIIHTLKEKIKELKCLHKIEKIFQNYMCIDEIMERVVRVVPEILQHPELAACAINLNGKHYSHPVNAQIIEKISQEIIIENRIEGNIEVGYTQQIPPEDGEIFLEEEKDALRHIAAWIANIVEYMKAKEELQKSREYFQKLVEESSDVIMVVDENTNVEYISPSIKNILGYSPEEIVGRSATEFIHPDDLQVAMKKFKEVLMNPEKIITTAFRIKHKNDGWRFVEVKGRNLLKNPTVGGVIVNFHDITELKKSEEKVRLLLNATSDLIILVEEDGTIVDLNEAMAKHFGKKREEIIGDNLKNCLSDDIYKSRFKKAIEAKHDKKPVFFIDTNDGRWFENRFYPIMDEDGNVTQIAAFIRDITEEKKREEEIKEKERQLRSLIDATHDLVILLKPDGIIVDLNEAMAKAMFGEKREDFIGKNIWDYKHVVPEDVFNKKVEMALEAIRTKKPVKFIDHPRRWFDNRYYPIIDENGNVSMIAMFSRDITETKEMEERFRQVAENANEWIWEVDREGVYTYSSPAVEKILGYKPEELIGKKRFYDLFHPDEREKLKEEAMKIFEERKLLRSFINKNIAKNGEERWLVTSGIPVFDVNGNWIGYRGMDLDVTELKKAQEEIKRLNRFLNSIIENANIWINVLDTEGNIIIWNKAAENISGYNKNEVMGNARIWEWLYPDEKYREKIFGKAMDIIEKGEVVENFETEITTKNGKRKIISWHSKRLLDENGKVIGSVAIGRDITKQKEAERLAKTLINATHDLMLLAKTDGTILDLNDAMARALGKKKEEIIGTNIREYLPPDVYEKRTAKVREVEKTKKEARFTDTRNGRWFDNCFYPVFDEHGNVRYIAVFSRDITEEREMEEKLQQHRRLMALGRLAAVVAHELNTPLANISVTADYLMEKVKDCREEIEVIKREVENAAGIIKSILNFSRMKITEKKEVNLGSLIDRVIENIRRIYGAKDTIFQNRVGKYVVYGNEERLFECFMNIVKNAVMAKDSKKKVHYVVVDAIEKDDMIEIVVKDNGVGMDEEVQKEATKPFFTTRKMGEGAGLGLFIASWVAEEHGGKIEIKSKRGEGTEVRVKIRVK